MMERMGHNHGGYQGERIILDDLLRQCLESAHLHGWRLDVILDGPALELIAFTRRAEGVDRSGRVPAVYLSSGIHGDEPAGPSAILRLLEGDLLPPRFDYWICPCLNPTGFAQGTRNNAESLDLNRDYKHPRSREVNSHIAWLARQPNFDLTFCLHEDWEAAGFYLYEVNPDGQPSLAEAMVESVRSVCPIEAAEIIEGRPARGGIIRPDLNPALRPEWPEAFYLLQAKTRLGYTLEAPSDYPMGTRVAALERGVLAGLRAWDGGVRQARPSQRADAT